ncbi:MAG: phosphoribosylpyrophosphate synthetase [Gammaproteobacteria bacterium CG_4_10_14_0_8_um_filter_38_16]|nr:MAG: phosphoribosylpyrophosphate synthetase [Gammaproteobacteria bacterium CG_4_10_14_0_8_um_filter_38_16]PJA03705.1 MAG: phosphoribosylpyrophosphate synthetase [Gammaproteobacteria bacterium CG_4_10_14_0_2_um_filter_38_22]PJB09993.1 MAG: phosphoribosylpyrophosphate synthetase [Gammaproteobacteria bacterium CG_4_9_14_3_um_filter_38_9]
MKPILFSLFNQHPLVSLIAEKMDIELGKIVWRDFPDGETYLKIENDIQNKKIIILNSLEHPNSKILPLLFLAETAKSLGAKQVGLCAPYLSYMRQDKQFQPGEGITSTYFATLLSRYFDWLVTVDPHLHRHHSLSEIYSIPNVVIHAAPFIAQWILKKINKPILIGPDRESEQWVSQVAKDANAPFLILDKIRHGDRNVDVSVPDIESYMNYTPVLIDDIISTAQTMIKTIHHLKKLNMKPPVCISVHAVFADNSYESLLKAGTENIVSCNTIAHVSNKIDLSDSIISEMQKQFKSSE